MLLTFCYYANTNFYICMKLYRDYVSSIPISASLVLCIFPFVSRVGGLLRLRGQTLIPFWQKSKPFDFDRFRRVSMGFDGFRWQVSTGFDGFRWVSISMPVETSGFCPATLGRMGKKSMKFLCSQV